MPPRVKYSRDAVISAAVNVVRKGGLSALNARSIAAELGCSTQPLYSVLGNMDELRKAVYAEAARRFYHCIANAPASPGTPPYKASGLALLRFANEERQLYKLLLLRDRSLEINGLEDPGLSQASDTAYDSIMKATGYSLETAKAFHGHMFVYIQGLAAMLASGYLPYDENRAGRLLTDEYKALRLLYDSEPCE